MGFRKPAASLPTCFVDWCHESIFSLPGVQSVHTTGSLGVRGPANTTLWQGLRGPVPTTPLVRCSLA